MAVIADISKWQGNIDWKVAAKEMHFCMMRASNAFTEDSMFKTNAQACKKYGVPFHV